MWQGSLVWQGSSIALVWQGSSIALLWQGSSSSSGKALV